MVPALFEKVGSVTHKLKIEPERVAETTDSSPGLKLKEASDALIDLPEVFTITLTVNVELDW